MNAAVVRFVRQNAWSLLAIAAVIDDDTKAPQERLYAADRALRMGKHERLAPLLKRIYHNTSDPVLRPGLHCLLWAWYGPALA